MILFLAMRTEFSEKALGDGKVHRRGDDIWLYADIDEAGDGAGSVVRVKG